MSEKPTTPPRSILLVINSNARNGKDRGEPLCRFFEAQGITVHFPRAPSHRSAMHSLINSHAKQVDSVVIGGGDGSLNAAADAIVSHGLTLGVIPLGTANDLARTLNLPTNPLQAAEVITQGYQQTIDLGSVNGHYFFNVASVGLSAELAQSLTKEVKRRWGKVGYGLTAAKLLWKSRPFGAIVQHDEGQERLKTVQVAVGNGLFYGGGMRVNTHASLTDGKFDVYSLNVLHWSELLALLPWLRNGMHGYWPNTRCFTTTELTLRTSKARPVNADGEILTTTPAHFKLHPHILQVYVPAPNGTTWPQKLKQAIGLQ